MILILEDADLTSILRCNGPQSLFSIKHHTEKLFTGTTSFKVRTENRDATSRERERTIVSVFLALSFIAYSNGLFDTLTTVQVVNYC